ncbi:hypothetical protein E4U60_001648 [Claviceps pazoutovae]|uniref:Uncharacterized protein n=1 Tax=Claviceps pazoutovae TaxID=1649127 RepID=A0A9P7MIY4_9HYPO|nr:hypothetical protein E4U60_001648 [Claviceps pazoutovae]
MPAMKGKEMAAAALQDFAESREQDRTNARQARGDHSGMRRTRYKRDRNGERWEGQVVEICSGVNRQRPEAAGP